jgi:hypothetical protein
MATIKWAGGTSTDASVAANWGGGVLPTASDEVHFDGVCTRICDMTNLGDIGFQAIHVHNDYAIFGGATPLVQFSGQTITLSNGVGLIVEQAEVFSMGSGTVFNFETTPTGANYDNAGGSTSKYAVRYTTDSKFDTSTNGIFDREASRENTTFSFVNGGAVEFSLADGVYPNVKIDPASGVTTFVTSNDYQNYDADTIPKLTKDTDFGYVSMLSLNFNNNPNVRVQPLSKTHDDKNKIFEINGAIQNIANNTFDWGYSCLHLRPTANSTLPVTGDTNFGVSTSLFTAKYNKLVIEESTTTSYYYKINANTRLNCNELVINGRFYGNADYGSTNTAEIHTIKPPIINGDWNFQQISDGIYRVRGTDELLPTAYGGTGERLVTNRFRLHPLYYSKASLDTNTGVAFTPAEIVMPYAGSPHTISLHFSGTISGSANNTFTIRKTLASDGSTSDVDISFAANTLNSNNSKVTDVPSLSFVAGDTLSLRRKSGTTDLNDAEATIWIQFD